MRIRVYVITAILFFHFFSNCVQSQLPNAMQAFSPVTGTYSLQHLDMNSFLVNPASLARLRVSGISFYGERRFQLKELSNYSIVTSLLTNAGNFGTGISYAGNSSYNEMQGFFSYGRKLGDRLDIGAQIHFLKISMQGYGNISAPGFEMGLMFHPTEKIHLGVKARDPIGRKTGKQHSETLPAIYVFGIGYEPSSQFLFSVELTKEENLPALASGRIQYNPHPAISLRSGIALFTNTAWFSFGWGKKNIRVDVSAAYHTQLGVSPGLQLSFEFPPKEK